MYDVSYGKGKPDDPLPEGAVGMVEITERWPLFAVKQLYPRTDFRRIRLEVASMLLVYALNVFAITIEVQDPVVSMWYVVPLLFIQCLAVVFSAYQAIRLSICSFILKRYMVRMKEEYLENQRSQGKL